jgi:hypothetical protein
MNNFFIRLGLAQRLALFCGGLCLLVSLAVIMVSTQSSRYILQEQRSRLAQQLCQQIAAEASGSLASGDLLSLEATLRQAQATYHLQYLAMYDIEARIIGAAGNSLGPGNPKFRQPVAIDGDIAGELLLELPPGETLLEQERMALGLFFLGLLLSLFAAALAAMQGQKSAQRISRLSAQLALDDVEDSEGDEILQLEKRVSRLPLELLRAPTSAPGSVSDYEAASMLYLRLNSLSAYVETLDESSLLRFTELQRKLVSDTAQLYGGKLSVVRQFGLLLTFAGEHASGNPAFRAAACAWLVQRQIDRLQPAARLNLSMSMAAAINEAGAGSRGDIYPDLYGQHIIDDLAAATASEPGEIRLSAGMMADPDIQERCISEQPPGEDGAVLKGFREPWADLIARQLKVLG